MATFPITLPLPQPAGYSIDPTPQGIATDMEVGASRLRRRTKARIDAITVTWIFDDAQYNAFLDWFYSDATDGAAGGTRWFDMQLLRGAGGLTTETARFKDSKYKAQLISGIDWSVSATIEVR